MMQRKSDEYVLAVIKVQRLTRVRQLVRSKELRLAKQGLRELEAKEAKTGSNPTVVETTYTPVVESSVAPAHLSPLPDPFAFDPSFSFLPDLNSINTPIL